MKSFNDYLEVIQEAKINPNKIIPLLAEALIAKESNVKINSSEANKAIEAMGIAKQYENKITADIRNNSIALSAITKAAAIVKELTKQADTKKYEEGTIGYYKKNIHFLINLNGVLLLYGDGDARDSKKIEMLAQHPDIEEAKIEEYKKYFEYLQAETGWKVRQNKNANSN
jgi:hypothetical protein